MIHVEQFRLLVVRPTLTHLALWSMAAENLLIGTAIQESGLRYLSRRNGGAARGLFQITPETDEDIHTGFLAHRPALAACIGNLLSAAPSRAEQLSVNLAYATAMARLIYYRSREPLPASTDVLGMARYWKRHFSMGRGSVPAFILNYRDFVPERARRS